MNVSISDLDELLNRCILPLSRVHHLSGFVARKLSGSNMSLWNWPMGRTSLLQKTRKMRFEQTYEGWQTGRLTQAQAAQILGMCDRSFRRYVARFEADGVQGLIDQRLEQVSNRCVLVPIVAAALKLITFPAMRPSRIDQHICSRKAASPG